MEQSTQTNTIVERPKRKKVDQKVPPYSLKKKIKKEQGKEQDYIIL